MINTTEPNPQEADIRSLKTKLLEEKAGMTEYLKLKMKQEDWHGVADAAMDIREIVAKLQILDSIGSA